MCAAFLTPSLSLQTIDVHVLVAPRALWQAELRCAYSSMCSQSVSAGFARSALAGYAHSAASPARCTSFSSAERLTPPSLTLALGSANHGAALEARSLCSATGDCALVIRGQHESAGSDHCSLAVDCNLGCLLIRVYGLLQIIYGCANSLSMLLHALGLWCLVATCVHSLTVIFLLVPQSLTRAVAARPAWGPHAATGARCAAWQICLSPQCGPPHGTGACHTSIRAVMLNALATLLLLSCRCQPGKKKDSKLPFLLHHL